MKEVTLNLDDLNSTQLALSWSPVRQDPRNKTRGLTVNVLFNKPRHQLVPYPYFFSLKVRRKRKREKGCLVTKGYCSLDVS